MKTGFVDILGTIYTYVAGCNNNSIALIDMESNNSDDDNLLF
jgi:hypothetical protein